jgi:glycosyltransferase involved in cell wall biosynthesis
MRVLAIGPTPPPYHGVATFLRDLLANARDPSVQIEHLDTADRRDASNLGRWDPVNLQLGFAHLAELGARCLRSGADVVYLPISQNVPAFLRDALFILQSRALSSRVVVHLHGGYFRDLYEKEGTIFQSVVRLALQRAAAVIVLSEDFRPIFRGLVPDEKIHVVENGVADPGAWHWRDRTRAIPPGGGTLLYMSTLTRTKGILQLLQAVSLIKRSRPEIRLRVAGNFSEEALRVEALDFVQKQGLAANVEFVGNVDGAAKTQFLASGDIFCLPTHYPYEGQPLVLLEAMAAGLPIVSTRHGAIPSTTPDGLVGRLLEKDAAPEALANVLAELLANAETLRCIGLSARERYLRHYTLEACHARLLHVLKTAVR